MAEIIELIDLVNLQNQTTAVNAINANNETIEVAFTDVLSLSGGQPNQMQSNIDMNSNHIINLPAPATSTEPLRLIDANTLNGGGTITVSSLPVGGTINQVLAKNSSTNYDASWQSFNSVPTGGLAGQVLTKNSSTNYDFSWLYQVSGKVTVTGTSTTYTSAQNNNIVVRSNSGAAMIDTLPGTSPGILPAGTTFRVFNNDASAMMAINVGAGATLVAKTPATGWVYLAPNQSVSFYSDGAAYWALNQPSLNILSGNVTLYCATTGSSTNHGLTASSPLDTPTNTYNLAKNVLALNGYTVTIQVADGTYTAPFVLQGAITGQGSEVQASSFPVIVQGDLAVPDNCIVSVSGSPFGAIQVLGGADVLIQGFKITTSGAGNGIYVESSKAAVKNVDFGACFVNHAAATRLGYLQMLPPYTISGSAQAHVLQSNSWVSYESSGVVTLTGTPNFVSGFLATQYTGSVIFDFTPTFSGSATGPRYIGFYNGIINTGGNLASLPGNAAGTLSTGAQAN